MESRDRPTWTGPFQFRQVIGFLMLLVHWLGARLVAITCGMPPAHMMMHHKECEKQQGCSAKDTKYHSWWLRKFETS